MSLAGSAGGPFEKVHAELLEGIQECPDIWLANAISFKRWDRDFCLRRHPRLGWVRIPPFPSGDDFCPPSPNLGVLVARERRRRELAAVLTDIFFGTFPVEIAERVWLTILWLEEGP